MTSDPSQNNPFTKICLIAAMLMPILYFGAQVVAAPFYPGYSFSRDVASLLGSSASLKPWIFNSTIILSGVAALIGAIGLTLAFRATTHVVLAGIIGLCALANGVMCIMGGIFPMPDPRHGGWAFLLLLTMIAPLLFLIGLWKRRDARGLRIYLLASNALLLLLMPFLFGSVSLSWLQGGTFQRLFAIAVLVPVGVVAYFFLRKP
jgi:hypothetical membrane protein